MKNQFARSQELSQAARLILRRYPSRVRGQSCYQSQVAKDPRRLHGTKERADSQTQIVAQETEHWGPTSERQTCPVECDRTREPSTASRWGELQWRRAYADGLR